MDIISNTPMIHAQQPAVQINTKILGIIAVATVTQIAQPVMAP
jgi:hypothetical protein